MWCEKSHQGTSSTTTTITAITIAPLPRPRNRSTANTHAPKTKLEQLVAPCVDAKSYTLTKKLQK